MKTRRDNNVLVLVVLFPLLIITVTIFMFNLQYNARKEAESHAIYQVCNQARISPTIDERGCADLQDVLHYKFLCADNNTNPTTHCWVERSK